MHYQIFRISNAYFKYIINKYSYDRKKEEEKEKR